MPIPCDEFDGNKPPVRELLRQMGTGKWWKVTREEVAQTQAADFRAAVSYHSRVMGAKAEVRKQGESYMVRLTPR